MTVLAVDDLVVEYPGRIEAVRALDGATVAADVGERLAIVGESGSGKSTLGAAIGRLLPLNGRIVSGRITIGDDDVLALDRRALRRLRGERLGFIPQDPIASLDPTKRVGRQLALAVRGVGEDTSRQHLESMLADVRIDDPRRVLRAFPHELSGGMAQRVAVAMAMARRPAILVADEPTASLDATVRNETLRLIFATAEANGTAVVWLSHDLDSVARWCDRVAVMSAGKVVESGPAAQVFADPQHDYTRSLLAAHPSRLVRESVVDMTPPEIETVAP